MIDDENTLVGVPLGKPLEEAAVQEFAAGFRGELNLTRRCQVRGGTRRL